MRKKGVTFSIFPKAGLASGRFPQIEGQPDYDSYLIMNQLQQASQFSFSRKKAPS